MILQDVKVPIRYTEADLLRAAGKSGHLKNEKIERIRIVRRSIDARKKPDLFYVMTLAVNEPEPQADRFISDLKLSEETRAEKQKEPPVAVIGMGPAGLFAADVLSAMGCRVEIYERGADVDTRTEDVERFFRTGKLDPESNVQFGEGGAGTFSDGKMNTRTKDPDGYKEYVLQRFCALGAKEELLYDAKAHIGTDALRELMKRFRGSLLSRGVGIRFHARVTDLEITDGRVTGIEVNESEKRPVSAVILAIGHSARDTYEMLLKHGISMEKKAFAAGVRMEHRQQDITRNQYGTLDYEELGAAPYAVTAKTSGGRGVFSFCMCPGGYVVNASSEERRLCINGMSYEDRASENANAGIVVQVFPEDYDTGEAKGSVLSGLSFQRSLEEKAYLVGEGKIPVQLYRDFRDGKTSEALGGIHPVMKGAFRLSDVSKVLPDFIVSALREAIPQFGRMIPGFDADDVLISAVESRTSSPVRIVRDGHLESNVKGLYPCGEGAGYAGGIVSAAMDGVRCAVALRKNTEKQNG
ncbi:MAG: FAD-binding protein [Lachnospiraceae bacterium]|nr:FAD-binding protein [Lachnospiraceae bacterium]